MNEVIGAKGSSNDRRRVFHISKKRLKKLKEYQAYLKKKKLELLEKKVKRIQIMTFIKVVPIVLALNVVDTIVKNSKAPKSNKKIMDNIEIKTVSKEKIKSNNKEKEQNKILDIINVLPTNIKDLKNSKKQKKDSKPIKNTQNKPKIVYASNVSKIRDKKIVGYYEDKFKEVRAEVKKLMYEYDKLNKKNINNYDIKELEKLKDDLNKLIKSLEWLRKSISIDDIPDKYFYNFIDEYIKKFENKEEVALVTDSKLYIMISEKLKLIDEIIDVKNEELKLEEEKQEFVEDSYEDEKIEELSDKYMDDDKKEFKEEVRSFKKDYFSFKDFNKKLDDFQKRQSKVLEEVKKVTSSTNDKTKKIIAKLNALNLECMLLFSIILSTAMKRPSVRTTKAMAISTLVGVYFMNQILNDKEYDNKEKKLKEEDFTKDIEENINSVDDVINLISKTSGEIDKLISNIKNEFGEYQNLDECKNLISNLETIKNEILEKEDEILRIRKKQEQALNKKVKRYE